MRLGNNRAGVGGSEGVNLTAVHPCGYGKQDTYEKRKAKSHWETTLLIRDLQILPSKEVGFYRHSIILCEIAEHATRGKTNLGGRRQSWAG